MMKLRKIIKYLSYGSCESVNQWGVLSRKASLMFLVQSRFPLWFSQPGLKLRNEADELLRLGFEPIFYMPYLNVYSSAGI